MKSHKNSSKVVVVNNSSKSSNSSPESKTTNYTVKSIKERKEIINEKNLLAYKKINLCRANLLKLALVDNNKKQQYFNNNNQILIIRHGIDITSSASFKLKSNEKNLFHFCSEIDSNLQIDSPENKKSKKLFDSEIKENRRNSAKVTFLDLFNTKRSFSNHKSEYSLKEKKIFADNLNILSNRLKNGNNNNYNSELDSLMQLTEIIKNNKIGIKKEKDQSKNILSSINCISKNDIGKLAIKSNFRSSSSTCSENNFTIKLNAVSPIVKMKEKISDNSLFKLIPCGTNKSNTGDMRKEK
jgi:hypothetical protein